MHQYCRLWRILQAMFQDNFFGNLYLADVLEAIENPAVRWHMATCIGVEDLAAAVEDLATEGLELPLKRFPEEFTLRDSVLVVRALLLRNSASQMISSANPS